MARDNARQIFEAKMQTIMARFARDEKAQVEKENAERQKAADDIAKLNVTATLLNMGKGFREGIVSHMREIEFDKAKMVQGVPVKQRKWDYKKDPGFLENIIAPIEKTEGYKEFKRKEFLESPEFAEEKEVFKEGALSWQKEEARKKMEADLAGEPLPPMEDFEKYGFSDQGEYADWIENRQFPQISPTVPAIQDMAALDESAKKELWNKWNQDQAKSAKRFGMPELTYDEWLKGVESGEISAVYQEKLVAPAPVRPEVPIDTEDEFFDEEVEVMEDPEDLLDPRDAPTYTSEQLQEIERGAEEWNPPTGRKRLSGFDPEVEDFDPTQITPTEGMPEHVPYASGSEGAPIPGAPIKPGVEIPDAKSGVVGKLLEHGQTALQLTNIGTTIADRNATDEDRSVASVQGLKLLTDLATERAGQQTVSQIGGKAATKFLTGKGLQEGAKLTGKQTVGAVLGGALGGYTAVTEAKEAGESWEEKDYDEAILHGVGSASGGLQTAGAGMMATGIGAPLGAVLYGIGTVGSVLSGAGLLLEGLFGKEEEEAPKPKFDASRYFKPAIRESRYY